MSKTGRYEVYHKNQSVVELSEDVVEFIDQHNIITGRDNRQYYLIASVLERINSTDFVVHKNTENLPEEIRPYYNKIYNV